MAFTVVLTNPFTMNKYGAVLKFNKILINRGSGYNEHTGIFTAPRSGLYQFSVTIMSVNGKSLSVAFYKNERKQLTLYATTTHGSQTANPVLLMKKGESISVRNEYGGYSYVHGYSYTYMSGFYIDEASQSSFPGK